MEKRPGRRGQTKKNTPHSSNLGNKTRNKIIWFPFEQGKLAYPNKWASLEGKNKRFLLVCSSIWWGAVENGFGHNFQEECSYIKLEASFRKHFHLVHPKLVIM